MAASISHEFPAQAVSWMQRDVLLFANSIGVKADELHFLYELHPRFTVFPTYPLMLPFKLTDQEVVEFYGRNATNDIPSAPNLDLRGAVDGQRRLTILKPIPTTSAGRQFELRNRLIGIYDKGSSGSSFETEQEIVDRQTGEVYARTRSMNFLPGQGNWGGPRGPSAPVHKLPNREPDAVHVVQTTDETVFLYRLNGDYNPLHAVPDKGLEMGFGGVIIHGLHTWSSACHGILRESCQSDPTRLREFEARFASPVRPGDQLTTRIWNLGVVDVDGVEEIRFQTVNQKGVVVLSNGRAILLPEMEKSKL